MTDKNEMDRRIVQRVDEMNIFLARYTKGILDTFILQAPNKKLSSSLRMLLACLLAHTDRFFHQIPRFSTWVADLALCN